METIMRDMDWFSRDMDWFRRAAARLSVAALLVVMPASLNAQFSIAPEIGVYVPTQPLVTAALQGDPSQFAQLKQEIALSLGGRMSIGFGRFGIEVSGAYTPSSVVLSSSGISLPDTSLSANLVTGTGQLWVQVLPASSPLSLGLSGGLSLTSRGGEAYAGAANTTDLGGVLGVSLGVRLGPVIHLMVTAEDYIYNLDPALVGLPPGVDVKTQHDIHLNFGIGIPLLGM
jgi:hypothetical protein